MSAHHKSLSQILHAHSAIDLASATGRTRRNTHAWRTGSALPDVGALPPLATFLKMDLAELVSLVATEYEKRRARRARGVA